jgi:ABC-type phosphate transport system substrate-binding protein
VLGLRHAARQLAIALLAAVCVGCQALAPLPDPNTDSQASPATQILAVPVVACWAGLPLLEDLIAAQNAPVDQVAYQLVGTHSQQAERMVADGRAELAIVAVPLDATGPGVRLALDGLAVIVPGGSAVTALERDELAALFEGYRLDWSELGEGSGRPELVVREGSAVERQLFEQRLLDGRSVTSAARLLPSDQAIVDYVAGHPNAVGLASAAWVDERVRAVAIGELLPTAQTIGSGAYPLVVALHLVVGPQASAPAKALAALAQGRTGRAIIARRYALPPTR